MLCRALLLPLMQRSAATATSVQFETREQRLSALVTLVVGTADGAAHVGEILEMVPGVERSRRCGLPGAAARGFAPTLQELANYGAATVS